MNQDTCFKSTEYEGVRIELHWDNDATCPREWDNLGHIVSFGRESFGDEEQPRMNAVEYLENLADDAMPGVHDRCDYWRRGRGYEIIRNREAKHGMPQGFERRVIDGVDAQCERIIKGALCNYVIFGLDSDAYGQGLHTDGLYYMDWEGLAYVTPETIRKEYSCKHITASTRAKVAKVLEQEINAYSKWRRGELCGYVIRLVHEDDTDDESGQGEVLASCWGFDDEDYAAEEAMREAVGLLDRVTHERAVKAWNASPMARELNYYV